jgi:hypothetical protein
VVTPEQGAAVIAADDAVVISTGMREKDRPRRGRD